MVKEFLSIGIKQQDLKTWTRLNQFASLFTKIILSQMHITSKHEIYSILITD